MKVVVVLALLIPATALADGANRCLGLSSDEHCSSGDSSTSSSSASSAGSASNSSDDVPSSGPRWVDQPLTPEEQRYLDQAMHRRWKPKRERGERSHTAIDVDGTPQIVGPDQVSRDLLDDDDVGDWRDQCRGQPRLLGVTDSANELRTVGSVLSFRQPNMLAKQNMRNIGRIGAETVLALGTDDPNGIISSVNDAYRDLFGANPVLDVLTSYRPKTWAEVQEQMRAWERDFWASFKGILGRIFWQ